MAKRKDRLDPFAFLIERYAERRADRLQAMEGWTRRHAEHAGRAELVPAFSEAVEGLSSAAALAATGVEKSAIGRLRSGASAPAELKGRTLEEIVRYMARKRASGTAA